MGDIALPTNDPTPLDDLLDAHESAVVDYERARHPRAVKRAKYEKHETYAMIVAHFAAIEGANRDERAAWSRCYALLTGDSGAYTLADLERVIASITATGVEILRPATAEDLRP